MIIMRALKVAATAAALLAFAGPSVADDCDKLIKDLKRAVDKVDPDKAGKNNPLKCAMMGEGTGMIKILRVITEECLESGAARTQELANLERMIRGAHQVIGMTCQ